MKALKRKTEMRKMTQEIEKHEKDARKTRGSSPRINLKSIVVISKSFNKFVSHSKSKKDLFEFSAENLVKMNLSLWKQSICTYRDMVIIALKCNFGIISPVSHKQVNARL